MDESSIYSGKTAAKGGDITFLVIGLNLYLATLFLNGQRNFLETKR